MPPARLPPAVLANRGADQVLSSIERYRRDVSGNGQRLVRQAVELGIALIEGEYGDADPAHILHALQQLRGRQRLAHDEQGFIAGRGPEPVKAYRQVRRRARRGRPAH